MIKAIVFDMDGVLCRSEEPRFDFLKRFFKNHNIQLDNKDLFKILGLGTLKSIKILSGGKFSSEQMQTICDAKKQYFNINKDKLIIPQEGLYELLDSLKEYKLVLATAAGKDYAYDVLKLLNVTKYFDFIFTAANVKNAKPHPEIYNKVQEALTKKFNISRDQIIVIEDSVPGVLSVKNANLKCVGLSNYNDEQKLINANSDYVVKSLIELKELFYTNSI